MMSLSKFQSNGRGNHEEVYHCSSNSRSCKWLDFYQLALLLVGMLTMLSFGFHSGWPSPALVKLLAEDSDIAVTSLQGAWIVAFLGVGCMCSAIFVPFLTDRWGRRTILLLSFVPSFAGCVMIVFATDYRILYLARFTVGLAIGASGLCVVMYVGEISENRLRAILGAFQNTMINIGILLAYCIGPWVNGRVIAAVGATIPIIFVLTFFWMPESPYYLIMKKNYDEARKSLSWLRGESDATEELKEIEQTIEFDQRHDGSYKELLMTPANRRALVIAIGLLHGQEFSGISVIVAYSGLIFKASGATLSINVSLIIIAIVQLLSGFIGVAVTKIVKRRPMLLISVSGSVIFLTCEALYFQLQMAGTDVTPISWLPITGLVGFLLFYTIGLGILPPSMYAEVFPCNVRARGLMLTQLIGFVGLIFLPQVYQIIAETFGIHYAFWLFTATTIWSGIFIYFLVPETKDKSFRDIHDHLRSITQSTPSASTIILKKRVVS